MAQKAIRYLFVDHKYYFKEEKSEHKLNAYL